MVIAASLMVAAALFTWFRGPRGTEAVAEDAITDLDTDLATDFGDSGLIGAPGA